MENVMKWVWICSALVGLAFLAKWGADVSGFSQSIRENAWLDANKTCISSHEEQYISRSPSVVVGGGKYGGGVAVPVGDDTIKTRTVCDDYSYPAMPENI